MKCMCVKGMRGYLCIDVCTCICAFVSLCCVYVCMCIYVFACTYICVNAWSCFCLYVSTCVCMFCIYVCSSSPSLHLCFLLTRKGCMYSLTSTILLQDLCFHRHVYICMLYQLCIPLFIIRNNSSQRPYIRRMKGGPKLNSVLTMPCYGN